MNISELIEELNHYMKDGGDREVLLEIDGERWGPTFKCTPINVIGAPTGLFRNGLNGVVITAKEIDKPEWIP